MSQKRLIIGRSTAREVIILVVGILIAFSLDAWWNRRIENTELQKELNNLLSEFHENKTLVKKYLHWHKRTNEATGSFLTLLSNSQTSTIEVPDSVIWATGFTPSLDARTGALDALIASGRLSLIKDTRLRNGLAGFRRYLTDAYDEQSQAEDYFNFQLVEVLYQSGDIMRPTTAFEWRDEGGPSNGTDLYTQIRVSSELKNHLARRLIMTYVCIESLKLVNEQVDLLIGLIITTQDN